MNVIFLPTFKALPRCAPLPIWCAAVLPGLSIQAAG